MTSAESGDACAPGDRNTLMTLPCLRSGRGSIEEIDPVASRSISAPDVGVVTSSARKGQKCALGTGRPPLASPPRSGRTVEHGADARARQRWRSLRTNMVTPASSFLRAGFAQR